MTSGPAREFCIEGEAGERDDAELHDDILDNAAADDAAILAVRNRMIAAGEDPELMKRFYPLSTELEAA